MTSLYVTATYFLWIVLLFVIVIGIKINSKKLKDTPQDDSNWNINYDNLKSALRKFVSNRNEEIVAVLGKVNAQTLLNSNINNVGFCILSDKAFYFVGKVWQKKGIFSFKSNIQHRIPITEMKGIKVGTLHRFGMFLLGIISMFVLTGQIRLFAWLVTHEDMVEAFDRVSRNDSFSVPFGRIAEFGGMFVIPIALVVMVYYIAQALLVKRTTVCIEMNGLTVNFLVGELGKQEIKDFYRDISIMQNDRISTTQNANVSQVNVNVDKVGKLTELSHLYEQGLLQQEEFERLKKEIIN